MSDLPVQLTGCIRTIDALGNTHFVDPKTNLLVASIMINQKDIHINAELGDDMMVTPFSFTYSGLIAVVYNEDVNMFDFDRLQSFSVVCAMMSLVTFADMCVVQSLKSAQIFVTTVHQFDVGEPEKYQLARELICYHTHKDWDDGYLLKVYRSQKLHRDAWSLAIMTAGDLPDCESV